MGALLAYSFSESATASTTSTDKGPFPEICGLALTAIGVFYVASFRRFRNRIHHKLPDGELKEFLANPGANRVLHQWNVFVVPFFAIDVFFVHKLACRTPWYAIAFWIFFAVIAVLFYKMWKWGKSDGTSSSEAQTKPNNGIQPPARKARLG